MCTMHLGSQFVALYIDEQTKNTAYTKHSQTDDYKYNKPGVKGHY